MRSVFGVFDISKPLTRMLPGLSPHDLRLMIPDLGIAPEGFSYMAVTSYLPRVCHFAPPAVAEGCVSDPAAAFKGGGAALSILSSLPGVGVSAQYAGILLRVSGENRHCLGHKYDECPSGVRTVVAVPGGMVHCLQDKHGGSQYMAVYNLGKIFPPWTVSRDFWLTAICPDVSGIAVDVRLFHEAGCRLVHKHRVYKDPFPHPALRGGGGGVINRLLALVGRAMAIAQLTPLHISIPASGAPPGEVSEECSPVELRFWVVSRH